MEPVFQFPFNPYPIQEKFMRELYFTIENRKLGIFESPTGTGKSLSICCAALQWLKDSNKKILKELKSEIGALKLEISQTMDSNDWLQEEYEKIKKNQMLITLQNKMDKIIQCKENFENMAKRVSKQKSNVNVKSTDNYCKSDRRKNSEPELEKENIEEQNDSEGDRDLILEEFEENAESDIYPEEVEEIDNKDEIIKVYISSRTHSQLSQFIGEIKRTIFKDVTRVVTLASRQHYCINSEVAKLKNVNLINERCLDMQKTKSKSTSTSDDGRVLKKSKLRACTACPYYNQNNITKLKERMLIEIMDMEDLVKCGKELKACPYYASRMAMDDAEVVLISHAGIVSSGARSGISLKLKDNILILDEAHGLSAALENAHSAPVTVKQLSSVKTYLQFYINKYRAKLSSRNLLSLNQISFVVGKLISLAKPKETEKNKETTILTLEDFVIKAEIDHMNLRPLVEFCRSTRLAPKLHGFSMRYSQQVLEEEESKKIAVKKNSFQKFLSNIAKKKELATVEETQTETNPIVQFATETSAGSGLYAVLDFLEMLCARSENGRVLVQQGDSGLLKYLLLNPAECFADVLAQCRSVIVAGGTMEPISEFKALLSSNGRSDSKLNIVRCEHVVPPHNILAVCLSRGPSNTVFNFSYENRMSKELLNEVGRTLRNVCSIVPGGVVCFLPSYSYEQTVYDHLKNNHIIDFISKRKSVFREPKSAADVEQVLHKYSLAVKNKEKNGALLLSVVGGKLSEGLNFSDDLGRCVIVVGMPYPNVKSPELQEKMSYLNRTAGGNAANIYYESLCMKAVNQCIGRAVRHINDYATVLLIDERYSRVQTISALPSFVQKSLISNSSFGQMIGSMAKFFSRHKEIKTN
ncbi:ATP-dependent DNA helicase DDX11 isoform X1 [Bombyx mandarina]|uniref:DNA 5'-3' helicase n=2 Tax=Bombyx mandarina TaxID=7092 RepID=A0A6J2JE12_BOMMA|nr:ATP-dependent DNA helicase DDX11 isoform X1 [Bombyx mandarina]